MKKVIACIIVCCILLCLFAACGRKETHKNIYISKDICPTKDEVIKNDEEHEIISVEDGGDKWICSVTPETWDKYYNETMIAIKESLEELCKDDEYAIIIKYEIAKDISSIKLFINEDDELAASFTSLAVKLVGSMFRFTLYGDTNFTCQLYNAETGKLIS